MSSFHRDLQEMAVIESHSLRQFFNRSQTCGFRELVTIFERFLLLKIVKSLDSQYWTSGEFHGKPHRHAVGGWRRSLITWEKVSGQQ
jgi:hypothetical protein